jgi:exopolyphosphatase / guanosine-5'-triphosphate,3'-diphosphate pyrophosphatase
MMSTQHSGNQRLSLNEQSLSEQSFDEQLLSEKSLTEQEDIVGALDLGSNTFILTLVKQDSKGQRSVLCDDVVYVRLGQGVHESRRFHPQVLERAAQALERFSHRLKSYQPRKVLAVATSAARDVTNQEELVSLCGSFGIPLQIISGDQEAQFTFHGATFFSFMKDPHWVLDIGGGSTEIIYGQGSQIFWRQSFDLGCVRLSEIWGQENQKGLEASALKEFSEKIPPLYVKDSCLVLAVAGTPVEIVRLLSPKDFDIQKVENFLISRKDLDDVFELVTARTPQQLFEEFGTPHGRGDVLYVGILLVRAFLQCVGAESFRVSSAGIRFGVIESLLRNL